MRFSALLITLDEALHITACLHSLSSAERIVVIDSGSADGTLQMAAAIPGVSVLTRPFDTFAEQRNYGLENCFAHDDWVLHVDADERVTPQLAAEIAGLEPAADAVAFNVASRTFLHGRPVLRASGYPVYQTRLTRAGRFRFEEVGHGQKAPRALGALPRLKQPYDHHPFEKGFEEWRSRHEAYAAKEAAEVLRGGARPRLAEALQDSVQRRQWLKHASAHVRARPWLVWSYLMFVRLGVLDGAPGWEYCRRRFLYERMVSDHVRAAAPTGSRRSGMRAM